MVEPASRGGCSDSGSCADTVVSGFDLRPLWVFPFNSLHLQSYLLRRYFGPSKSTHPSPTFETKLRLEALGTDWPLFPNVPELSEHSELVAGRDTLPPVGMRSVHGGRSFRTVGALLDLPEGNPLLHHWIFFWIFDLDHLGEEDHLYRPGPRRSSGSYRSSSAMPF